MSNDDEKLTYSERDRLRREGGGERPKTGRARATDERKTKDALKVADSLFAGDTAGEEGKVLGQAVHDAHGSADLPTACRAYYEALGVPADLALASIFFDAAEKDLTVAVLDDLLQRKDQGALELEGGLKRQVRILSEDFDDDLASRAEDLLE
jgi:hypothetical protein